MKRNLLLSGHALIFGHAFTTIDSTTLALVNINDPVISTRQCYGSTQVIAGTSSNTATTCNNCFTACPNTGFEGDDCMVATGTGSNWGSRYNRACDIKDASITGGYVNFRRTFGSTTVLNIYPETVCKSSNIYQSTYNAHGARFTATSSNTNYIKGCIEKCNENSQCAYASWEVSKCSPKLSTDVYNFNFTCSMYSSCTPVKQTLTDSFCGPSISAPFGYALQTTTITDGAYYSTSTVYQVRITAAPTTQPTNQPTVPTASPTIPTVEPTTQPTNQPTVPTAEPTIPTAAPTTQPSNQPTVPTAAPTIPTAAPTTQPTNQPTVPTAVPTIPTSVWSATAAPTTQPTNQPTAPTDAPTIPTATPTNQPTNQPTVPTIPTAAPPPEPRLLSDTMFNFCIQNSILFTDCLGVALTSNQRILGRLSEMQVLRLSNYLFTTDIPCASITATFTDYLRRQLFSSAMFFNETSCSISWPEASLLSTGVVIFRLHSVSYTTQVFDMGAFFGIRSSSAYTAFQFNVDRDNIIRLIMNNNHCTTEPLDVRFVMSHSCSVFAVKQKSKLTYQAEMPECLVNNNYVRASFTLDEACQQKVSVDIFNNAIVLPIGQNPIFIDNLIYI